MAAPQQKHRWSQVEEKCSSLGIRIMLLAFKLGGRPFIVFCLYFVICFYFLASGNARRHSLEYLRQVHRFMGAESPWKKPPGLYQSFRHFMAFGNALVDKCIVWMGYYKNRDLQFTDRRFFEEVQERKTGGIILMSHLGNVEICRALGAFKGVSLTILAYDKHTPEFHRILSKIAGGNEYINVLQIESIDASLALRLQATLDAGGYIAIAGDRIPVEENGRCEELEFLGRTAPFAQGPMMMAVLFKCPVLLLFCMREKKGYHVFFELFSEGLDIPRKERKQRLKEEMQRYASRLEHYACQYPLQWYNFFGYWSDGDMISEAERRDM